MSGTTPLNPQPLSAIIVVRLVPTQVSAGSDFAATLQNLSISAYDRTVNNTSPDVVTGLNDTPLGTASGLISIPEFLIVNPGTASALPSIPNSIIQHFDITTTPITPLAAATALIVVNTIDFTKYQEYPQISWTNWPTTPSTVDFDLRFEITQSKQSQPTVNNAVAYIEYNVQNVWGPADLTLLSGTDSLSFQQLAATAYVQIPPVTTPGASSVQLRSDGQPPNFGNLVTAIDAVLAGDHPANAPTLEKMTQPLTIAQCQEIASEMIYDRAVNAPPLPQGSEDIGWYYTAGYNTQTADSNSKQTYVRSNFSHAMFLVVLLENYC
jgi:hypothetical protein